MSSQVVSLKADEAVNWFQKRLRNAISYGLSIDDYKMFDVFITSTLTDVDVKKQMTNTVLPTFFENIVSRKVHKPTIDAQASIIRLFMKYYGGTCGQFKNALDKFTSKTLSECFNEENIMVKVTKYLALYSQCGGRGQQGINHAEAWTSQFNDYLYSANYFLNQLYSNINFFTGMNVTDKYEGKFDISVFNLSEIELFTPKERYEKLTSLFIFFNTAIQSMLLSSFSTVKHFDSNKIIQLAISTLSITSEKLNNTMITEDVIALDSVLWKVHCSVIKTISALIKCCGRILIPHGILLCRILLQSINMTNFNSSNSIYGTTRSKLQQRVLTYQVLCSWLAVAGSQSSLTMFSESLVSGILSDIKYDKPSLNLIVDKQTGNKKRKSGALNEKIINQRDTIIMHDYHANKTICNEAHVTLQLFLNTLSSDLKPIQFKIFQSTIMSLLLDIIKCQRPSDYPLPYYDDSCRLNLYKSLLATIVSPHPQCIAQTSVALHIFTSGITDQKENIKEVCRSSISKLEHIIRPRNDTLFFPLEKEVEVPEFSQNALPENKTHFLSDKIEDSDLPNKEKKPSHIDEIKPIKTTSKLYPPNVIKCDSLVTNTPLSSSQEIIINNDKKTSKEKTQEIIFNDDKKSNEEKTQEIIIKNDKKSNKEKTQEIIIKNDKMSNEEKTQEQIIQPAISEIRVDSFTTTPINLKQANKVIELMDVENKIDSSDESSDDIEEAPEGNFAEMLNDFIDSD